jgi:hypothetical protein
LENLPFSLSNQDLEAILERDFAIKPYVPFLQILRLRTRVCIIFYGPKSSGKGFVGLYAIEKVLIVEELASMSEALLALQKLNGAEISGRKIQALLKKKNNFENKTKPKKKPQPKKEWVHLQVISTKVCLLIAQRNFRE